MSQSTQATAILGLLTETSLHAGAGSTVGVIDLPIQREAHTGYPCIFGSSVKGPMRTLAEQKWAGPNKSLVEEIFGPNVEDSKTEDGFHAGALAVSDARLLLLPVRSLTSHFKWVTCPAILRRWQADYRRLQMTKGGNHEFPLPEPKHDDIALVATAPNSNSGLFLEEFRFKAETDQDKLEKVIKQIIPLMGREDAETALTKQLTVVSDDMFSHLAKYATPVNAHIALNYETKVVKPGALWYEETLPPETLLYVTLVTHKIRKSGEVKNAEGVLTCTKTLFDPPYLQLGGNETVGMGWCKVSIVA